MPNVRKSVIVPHPCATMFALIDACERYPEFLPWCSGGEVFERTDAVTRARIDIDYHGLKTHVSTRNAKDAPRAMDLEFVDGPFEAFRGQWRLAPLGEEGCRVELALDYAFESAALETLLGAVFGHVMETLVDGFVARAEALAQEGAP